MLAPTLSTRGLLATAPYLRDGSFVRLRDLDYVAENLYRGYRRRGGDRGAQLAAYLERLPRRTNPSVFEERDLERERRGVDAFVKARCDVCHTFPAR